MLAMRRHSERLISYAADRLRTLAREMLRENRLQRWEESDDLLQQTLVRSDP